jgi:hypothetical protein
LVKLHGRRVYPQLAQFVVDPRYVVRHRLTGIALWRVIQGLCNTCTQPLYVLATKLLGADYHPGRVKVRLAGGWLAVLNEVKLGVHQLGNTTFYAGRQVPKLAVLRLIHPVLLVGALDGVPQLGQQRRLSSVNRHFNPPS